MPSLLSPSPSLRGIYAKLLAVVLFATMDAAVKGLANAYPTMQVMFFRALFGFGPLLLAIHFAGGWGTIRSRQPVLQTLRTLVGFCALYGLFWAFPRMQLANVYAILYASPIVITALSLPLLGERVDWRRWLAIVVGFLGVLVVLDPRTGFDVAELVVVGTTILYALWAIGIRLLSRTDHDNATMFYFAALTLAGSSAFCAFDPEMHWTTPTLGGLGWLAAIGLLSGLGQICITRAFRLAPASTIAPFEYTSIVFAFVFGWFVFGEAPSAVLIVGLPLVVGSGLYILAAERKLAREAHAASVGGGPVP